MPVVCGGIEEGWNGIKPLITDAKTVENILGKPEISGNYKNYKTSDAFIQINYSTNPCQKDKLNRGKYNVPEGTVLDYNVFVKKGLKLTDLEIDLKKYRRIDDSELLNVTHYYNNKEGLQIDVQIQNGVEYVGVLRFKPNEQNTKSLKCKDY